MWLAQTTPSFDPISLLQLGLAGTVIFFLVSGILWPKPAVEQIIRERDEFSRRLQEREQEVLKALVREQEALKALVEINQTMKAVLARVEELARAQGRWEGPQK